jgi:predicted Zn-dependent peptidase
VSLSVPAGSADDPPDAPGLAFITADMLDEGAGSRNAVEFSSAVNDLGATLSLGAGVDASFASLTVLKKNFTPALGLLADAVLHPRFEPKEWKRVHELWENDLKKRADDPAEVSRVVTLAAVFGPKSPYGHPSDGFAPAAKKIDLPRVKSFYADRWRPNGAVLVVAGDITKAELTTAMGQAFDGWKPAPDRAPAPKSASAPASPPKLILVDRRDAPQSVIAVVRGGVAAGDPSAPVLSLVSTALGGSFTSRLNQNLREDHGYTYGARSSFSETKQPGSFVARAAVRTDVTGAALKEMLHELELMADKGMDKDELAKVRAHDRADLVQRYETTNSVTRRLAALASLGLAPTFDVTASRARQDATLETVLALAKERIDPKPATIVVVGPRTEVEPQLASLGLPAPVLWDADGNPVSGAKASSSAAPAKSNKQR